jgi:hypothetical protein
LRVIMGVVAAALFAVAGVQMLSLHSQAGNTVAEAFYNAVGLLSLGLAALSVAVAMPQTTATAGPPRVESSLPQSLYASDPPPDSADSGQLTRRVAGWDPTGERACPHCRKQVAQNRRLTATIAGSRWSCTPDH